MLQSKIKAYILVRDKYGRPKLDNYNNIPKEVYDSLTDKDKIYIEKQRRKINGNNPCISNN